MKVKKFQVDGLEALEQKVNQLNQLSQTVTTLKKVVDATIRGPERENSDSYGGVVINRDAVDSSIDVAGVQIIGSDLSSGENKIRIIHGSKKIGEQGGIPVGTPGPSDGLFLEEESFFGATTPVRIHNVADPYLPQDAATKNYVDSKKITADNIDFATLFNMKQHTNSGNAGGSMMTFNLGDIKIATGTTATITGTGEYSRNITFPTGFFTTKPNFIFNVSQASGSVSGNFAVGNTVNATHALIYMRNTTGSASVGGQIGWIAIGT